MKFLGLFQFSSTEPYRPWRDPGFLTVALWGIIQTLFCLLIWAVAGTSVSFLMAPVLGFNIFFFIVWAGLIAFTRGRRASFLVGFIFSVIITIIMMIVIGEYEGDRLHEAMLDNLEREGAEWTEAFLFEQK